jgi:Pyridoxamine 5'-phosphate oxidase
MPKPPLPPELDALLREPNPAVIATLKPDGAPHSVATWYLRGRVTELAEDAGLRNIDRISQHYRGRPYPARDNKRYDAWIEITTWHAWGA